MKKIILLLCLTSTSLFAGLLTITNNNGSVFFYQASDVPLSRITGLNPNIAGGNMASATNLIHPVNMVISGNYTISEQDSIQSASSFFTFWCDTSAGNMTLTYPTNFTFEFKVINIGTNNLTNAAPSGRAFAVLPLAGGVSYQATILNRYVGKSQTFKQYGTNYWVSDDFRPIKNIIDDVTNNIVLSSGTNSGSGGVSLWNWSLPGIYPNGNTGNGGGWTANTTSIYPQ